MGSSLQHTLVAPPNPFLHLSYTMSPPATLVATATPRNHRSRPDRRTHRAKSMGPTSRPPQLPPAWDTDLTSSASHQGFFAADGTFVLDGSATARSSREKGPRKSNRRQRSPSRPTRKPMATGHFTADGQFVEGPQDDPSVLSDSAVPSSSSRPDYSASFSSLPHSVRPFSGKKHRGSGGSNTASTPAKEPAYAGPTFHASPDPSTLPLPRFFSATRSGLAKSDGEESVPEISSSNNSPVDLHSPPVTPTSRLTHLREPDNKESPLDIFFASKSKGPNSGSQSTPDRSSQSQSSPTPETPALPAQVKTIQSATKPGSKTDFLNQLIGSVHGSTRPSPRPALAHRTPQAAGASLDDKPSPFITHPFTHAPYGSMGSNGPHTDRPFHQQGHGQFPQSEPSTYRQFHYPNPASSPYHYGNANLSQLFKAAASPPRQNNRRHPSHSFRHHARSNTSSADMRHLEDNFRQLSTARN